MKLRPYFDIYFQNSLYMRRWWIFGDEAARDAGKITVGLQHIVRRDRAPDMHTHPCTFISIVLWRWYRERRPRRQRQSAMIDDLEFIERIRWPGSIALRRSTDRHNITEVAPGGVWTLIIWLRKFRSTRP